MSAPAPCTVNVPPAHDAVPASPVSPTSECVHGTGRSPPYPGPSISATLSNVDVFTTDESWLVTISPAVTQPSPAFISAKFGSVLPSSVHCSPSVDTNPLTVVPARASFNHTGAGRMVPARYVVTSPKLVLVMNSMSPVGRT